MKVLDPQSALITNAEVYSFLQDHPLRKPEKRVGAYEPVNLSEAATVRKDFNRYIELTSPHIKQYPKNNEFIPTVVRRLRKYDLTKTEVFSLINLGLGLPRDQPANTNTEGTTDAEGPLDVKKETESTDSTAETELRPSDTLTQTVDPTVSVEPNFRALLECVIENVGERFTGDEGEEAIEQILRVLEECSNS